jgi:hypothetical protein
MSTMPWSLAAVIQFAAQFKQVLERAPEAIQRSSNNAISSRAWAGNFSSSGRALSPLLLSPGDSK